MASQVFTAVATVLMATSVPALAQTAELDIDRLGNASTTQQVNAELERAGYVYKLAIPHVKNAPDHNASSFLAVRESDDSAILFSMEREPRGSLSVKIIEQLTNISFVRPNQLAELSFSVELGREGEITCRDNGDCVSISELARIINAQMGSDLAFSGTKPDGELLVGLVNTTPNPQLRNRCEFSIQTSILQTYNGALTSRSDIPAHCGPTIFGQQ